MSRIESPRLPETFFKNLRSGLDHLAYALFMVGPRDTSGSPAKHVYFPISDDSTKYVAESRGRVKGMRRDAIDAINAVKPYKGGNDTLWVLHKLNNVDKHRFVIIVGSAFHSVGLGPHVLGLMAAQVPALANMEPLHAFFKPAVRMFPLKEGDELFIDAPNAEVNHKMQFRFDVAFGEPGIIEGESLLPTLHEMVNVVANVVTSFDSML